MHIHSQIAIGCHTHQEHAHILVYTISLYIYIIEIDLIPRCDFVRNRQYSKTHNNPNLRCVSTLTRAAKVFWFSVASK